MSAITILTATKNTATQSPRILVGQFLLEANSFAPGATTLADFSHAGLYFGQQLTRQRLPDGNELAAAWDVFDEHDCEVVPSVRAYFGAGPPASTEAWTAIRDSIVDNATADLDCVYVALHGAALATGVDDPEGALLAALRDRLGPDIPIAISLDCHAGWTPLMEASCDIATAYGTVPHVDLRRTGAQAADLLLRTIRGEINPVTRGAHLPMVGGAIRQDSNTPEFRAILEAARSHEQRPGVLAAAVLPSHPWRDVPQLSWSAIATTDGDAALAQNVARALAANLWEHRTWLVASDALPIDLAITEALDAPGPVVLADAGDSPTGGSLGDSTELLRAGLRAGLDRREAHTWMLVTDPDAVRRAREVAEGSTMSLAIGTGRPGSFNECVTLDVEVVNHRDGGFTYSGPFAGGVTANMGDTSVVRCGSLHVALHEHSVMEIDPAPLLHAGMDASQTHIMQAKSHVSFRAGFADIGRSFVVADTPGPTAMSLPLLPYRRRPTPLYPFERDVSYGTTSAS